MIIISLDEKNCKYRISHDVRSYMIFVQLVCFLSPRLGNKHFIFGKPETTLNRMLLIYNSTLFN